MREYTFLLSGARRTEHVRCRNLREAVRLTTKLMLDNFNTYYACILLKSYQSAGNSVFYMNGWKSIHDKKLRKAIDNFNKGWEEMVSLSEFLES